MRRKPAPHDLTGKTESIEQIRRISRNPAPQYIRFPCCGGNFIALKLLENLKRSIDAMQLSPGRDMLPGKKKSDEVRGSHRLDLFPEFTQGHAMDPCEQPPVAPFDFTLRHLRTGCKAPAQHLTRCFE